MIGTERWCLHGHDGPRTYFGSRGLFGRADFLVLAAKARIPPGFQALSSNTVEAE
jgi:hypothetical protein